MDDFCHKLVADLDKRLLKEPDKASFGYAARTIYERGYIAGKAMEQRLMRLRLGLGVPSDSEEGGSQH